MKTVQTQIRRHRLQYMVRVSSFCLQGVRKQFELKKNEKVKSLNLKLTGPIDKKGTFHLS